MSRSIDLTEKLARLTEQSLSCVDAENQAICRRFNAQGMLNSGNRLSAQLSLFQSSFKSALCQMALYAVEVVSPRAAIRFVRREATSLEIQFSNDFDSILAGKGSGIETEEKLRNDLSSKLALSMRSSRIDVENDIATGVMIGKNGPKGVVAYVQKNVWKFVTAIFTAVGIYVTWLKR